MLGSLARKLRALGFEAAYYRSGDDKGIINLASAQRSVILTSDRSLHRLATSRGLGCYLLKGKSDSRRISEIAGASHSGGTLLVRGEPLCSVCGGELEKVPRDGVALPEKVLTRHRLFFKCTECGKVYWRGSHWKKLRSLARRLEVG